MSVEFVISTFSSIRSVRFPLVIPSCSHQQECVALCGLYRVPGQFSFSNSSSRTSLDPAELNYGLTQLQSMPILNILEGCIPKSPKPVSSGQQGTHILGKFSKWTQKNHGEHRNIQSSGNFLYLTAQSCKPGPHSTPFCSNGFTVLFSRMSLTSYSYPCGSI